VSLSKYQESYILDARCRMGEDQYILQFPLLKACIPTSYQQQILSAPPQEISCKELDPINMKGSSLFFLYEGLLERYLDAEGKVFERGLSLFFWGPNGVGKTYASVYLLAAFVARGHSGLFIRFKDLYNLYNIQLYDRDNPSAQDYPKLIDVDFLVIDELGVETLSEGVRSMIDELIRVRKDRMKPTIITTNIDVRDGQLSKRYGTGLWSAMMEKWRFIFFSESSEMRTKLRDKWEDI
jgi:hypothetical protein